jgi:hypothetical protein
MSLPRPTRIGAAMLAALSIAPAGAAESESNWLLGSWRVTRGLAAPWVEDRRGPDVAALLGQRIEYRADRVEAPSILGCANARYEFDQREPAGLFQGNLPEPATTAAGDLGLTAARSASASVICDNGIFDLHRATPDAALMALDNVIWTLDRSVGALAPEGSPEFAVQRLLEAHVGADMGFLPELVRNKRVFLTDALNRRIDTYFAQPFPQDEVPPIDGDPFTDSQEYPAFFSVGAHTAAAQENRAEVPVRFDDGYRPRSALFLLRRETGGWRVDDITYDHGATFSALLASKPS